jgi:dephospho-CoA kinase
MLRAGLTGGIGSGKSLVARMLRILGVPVFEADREARKLMEQDPGLVRSVAERFGKEIYVQGRLDRKALAAVVFNDPVALRELNALVHPVTRQAFNTWAGDQKAPWVAMEAAILAETGGHKAFDTIIVVSAPEDVRLRRVMERDGVGEEAARARMRNQAQEEERLAIADHVILNDDHHLVIPQVLRIHEVLARSAS